MISNLLEGELFILLIKWNTLKFTIIQNEYVLLLVIKIRTRDNKYASTNLAI